MGCGSPGPPSRPSRVAPRRCSGWTAQAADGSPGAAPEPKPESTGIRPCWRTGATRRLTQPAKVEPATPEIGWRSSRSTVSWRSHRGARWPLPIFPELRELRGDVPLERGARASLSDPVNRLARTVAREDGSGVAGQGAQDGPAVRVPHPQRPVVGPGDEPAPVLAESVRGYPNRTGPTNSPHLARGPFAPIESGRGQFATDRASRARIGWVRVGGIP